MSAASPLRESGHPIGDVYLTRAEIAARVREFRREPAAIFWVYVFPLILVLALGVAFRNKPVGGFTVAVQSGGRADQVRQTLERDGRFRVVRG